MNLTSEEKLLLGFMQKGCAVDASSRALKAADRRACENLVRLGLAKKTNPVKWNKSGAYCATQKGKDFAL